MHRLCLLLLLVGTTLACNELENLVNKERKKRGLRALHCDASMRWVAGKHLEDQEQGAAKNLALGPECNVHSWLVMSPCCYKRDHSNMQCMHNKPLVRNIFFCSYSDKPSQQRRSISSEQISFQERIHYQSQWAIFSRSVFIAYFRSCLVGTRDSVLKYLLGSQETWPRKGRSTCGEGRPATTL